MSFSKSLANLPPAARDAILLMTTSIVLAASGCGDGGSTARGADLGEDGSVDAAPRGDASTPGDGPVEDRRAGDAAEREASLPPDAQVRDSRAAVDAAPDAPDAALLGPVRGTIVDGQSNMPIVGATVIIDGITAVSDVYGAFSVPDVAPQYDMMVLPGGRAAEFYVGLSTRQPVVRLSVLPLTLPHLATVSGSLGPSAYVGPTAAVGYTSARLAKGGATLLAPGASDYGPFQVAWGSNQPVNGGTLYAITWTLDSAEELPTAYTGWGTRAITLAADTTLLRQDITLNAVTARNVQVTVGLPTGLTLDGIGGMVGEISLFVDGAPFANAYPLPAGLGELSPTVGAIASAASALQAGFCQRKVEDGSNAVHLPLPPQPLFALPIDAAPNVGPGTRFSWTAVPGAVYQLALILPDAVFTVYTADLDAAFPDTAAVGIPLSSGPATWRLKSISPALSVDAVVSEREILDVEGIRCESLSGTRTFNVSAQ